MTESPEETWTDLMEKARQGDQDAYRLLLMEVTPLLRRFILSKGIPRHEVEDVLQDTLLSLHKVRHTYDTSRPFKSWIFAIAHFRAVDCIRERRRSLRHVSDDVLIDVASPNLPDHALREDLAQALNALPERQREVVTLLKIKDASVAATASLLGMSVSSVKVTAHRAYKTLKKALEGKRYEDE